MAHDEFRDAVAAMSPERRADFDRITKRRGDTPEQCVCHLVSYPGDMQKYYDAAGVTMPEQKALDATVSMADSSKRSADAAERSASSARWSMLWAFIAAIVAIASLIWQMLTSR